MTELAQHLLNGLTMGSVYALVAVGFSIVWATIRSMNFAHGELYMLGGYTTFGLGAAVVAGLPLAPVAAIAVAVLAAAVVGAGGSVLTERVIMRPLRDAPVTVPVLATLAAGILIHNVVMLLFGTGFKTFPVQVPRGSFVLGDVRVNVFQLVTIAVVIVLIGAVSTFMNRTRTGLAMRAMAWDREVAGLMGVDEDRMAVVAFLLAGALAGIGGAFVILYFGVMSFFAGFMAAVKGWTAAVLGGFGHIWGALIGGLVLGLLEALAAGYISSRWKDAIAFIVLGLVVLIRPTGILGERLPARV